MDADALRHYTIQTIAGFAVAAILVAGLLTWMWQARPTLDAIAWPDIEGAEPEPGDVTMTWLGVTTLLFDDGETQILIDGFISRPGMIDIVLRRDVSNNIPLINEVLLDYRMRRLAAIIPVHSHFDHAMDIGAIANRSSASILGTDSTANIARGAGVPDDQIVIATHSREYAFGQFTVKMLEVPHAPVGWRGETPLRGSIDRPLTTPASIGAWRTTSSYSILISHPQGTTLVQGSAGFSEKALAGISADVVLLGVGQLETLGRSYAERYWQTVVTTSGASRVFPIHFDDLTAPFGDIRLPPRLIDNFPQTAGWLAEFRQTWDQDVSLYLPVFGRPVAIYSIDPPPSS
jgi:L-ascorbate metabolism protein UlaG (beta-lactamase superfamily)